MTEFSSFLNDLTKLYEIVAMLGIPDYAHSQINGTFFFDNQTNLKRQHTLYLESINRNSPLTLEVVIPLAAGALGIPWLFLQSIEKIQNWKLNREKLQLEVQKLKLENTQKELDIESKQFEIDQLAEQRGADRILNEVLDRLSGRELIGVEIKVNNRLNNYDVKSD